MQNERYFYYESNGIYTRKFKYHKHAEDERVFLKFSGAAYAARVFLNRQFIGAHEGASTPFYFEITEHLAEDNRLWVIIENRRRPDRVPMHNTDWFNYGGLYRDVSLFRVPRTMISDYVIQLQPHSQYRKIDVTVQLNGPDEPDSALLQIDELNIRSVISLRNGRGSATIEATPELWTPERPRLYRVHLSCGQDRISEDIGFREIAVQGTDILLNGKKIFLRGISAHEESVKNGKAVTAEEVAETFTIAKELGCNFMRLAHYPHSENAARLADRMGLLLWEEIPVYWSIAFDNPKTYIDAENQLFEMIKRDRNRASVIIWSVGNENADTDSRLAFMKRLAQGARGLDPTRLISAACIVNKVDNIIEDRLVEELDVIGINEYYGWYEPDFSKLPKLFENSHPQKPVLITEFGGDARAGHRGSMDEYFTEDHQRALYRQQIDTLRRIPYVKGMTPWILYDFRCPRRTNPYQDYYNRKGLLSEDKQRRKLAFYVLQDYYREKREEDASS